jgi:5-methylcytosine-specific restriction enzyme A
VNRKQFLDEHDVFRNTDFSWSGVNHRQKKVLFGAWVDEAKSSDGGTRIFSPQWSRGEDGKRKNPNYKEALLNLTYVIDLGYDLFTFPMQPKVGKDGKIRLGKIDPVLTECWLVAEGVDYFAVPFDNIRVFESLTKSDATFWEGAKYQIIATGYERSPKARFQCLDAHGYSCAACNFDFENSYGEIGRRYIHVHHLVRMADRPKPYEIDGKEEMRPLCPNCHAMVHTRVPPFDIDELKAKLAQQEKLQRGNP